ncbi:MAG: hypothetical protein J4N94_02940, partial [Chloroflexi bacterium]|nr:hypothetical protein [Chloroflexota bacterium]
KDKDNGSVMEFSTPPDVLCAFTGVAPLRVHSDGRRVGRSRADEPKFAFNLGPAFRWHVARLAYPGMIGGIGLLPRRIWGSARTSGTPY